MADLLNIRFHPYIDRSPDGNFRRCLRGKTMREWLIAVMLALPLWIALPFFIAHSKRRHRGKKRSAAFGSALQAGFDVFDPAKARAVEMIQIRQEIGHADEGNQGELLDHQNENNNSAAKQP